jgi:chitinase
VRTSRRMLTAVAAAASVSVAVTLLATTAHAASTNLLTNPGFETGTLAGWTCDSGTAAVTSTTVHSGSYALAATPTSSDDAQCTQTVTVAPSTAYTLSGYVEGAYVYLGATGTGVSASNWTTTSSYTQLSTSFTTGASTTSVTVYIHGWYAQGTYYADDLALTGPAGSGGGGGTTTTTTTGGGGSGTPPTGDGQVSTPANVSVSGVTSSSITLSWTASTDSSGTGDTPAYYVYDGSNIVAAADGTAVTVSSLKPATQYTFTVVGYDVSGHSSATPSAAASATTSAASSSGYVRSAYFDQWSIYGNAYYPKSVAASGAASGLNILTYAFENIDPSNLTCFEAIKASDSTNESDPNAGDGAGDAYADYQKEYSSADSVDGTSDTWSQPLVGNFNQLRELKAQHPNLKIVLSLGGWTYSKYFSDVAATAASRQKFVSSCIDMFIKGNLPTGVQGSQYGGAASAAGLFDGIDIDWEYPASAGGHTGNHYSTADTANYTLLLQEFRTELDAYGATIGKHYLLTAALPSGQDKISLIQTSQIGAYLDYGDVMTYDMHGAWETTGPTNFQDPVHLSSSDPSSVIPPGNEKYTIDTAITAYTTGLSDYGITGGFPASKIVLGVPFYWRGWSGVTAGANYGLYQSATGASPAFSYSQTAGTAFYKELESAGLTGSDVHWNSTTDAAWSYDGSNFYTGDTPTSIATRAAYAKSDGLAGMFAFSLEGDDASGTLINALTTDMR